MQVIPKKCLAVCFAAILVVQVLDAGSARTADLKHNLTVVVVGDTGIGERGYHSGFEAVQKAMAKLGADVLLHLGDFVYQPEMFPDTCNRDYIREIRETLVDPYPSRLFVLGDNDLPPMKWKPKASGCWKHIDPLDTPFDSFPEPGPAAYEGTKVFGNVLFAILNTHPWNDPTSWLQPRIEQARRDGLWIIVALHEPAVTTAWFLDKRKTVFKQVNALKPDLVFAGNQHSYERFKPLGDPLEGGALSVAQSESKTYVRGQGVIHIVSGGGGATFKPFADMQGMEKRTAPKDVFDALAVRALINHFVLLEFSTDAVQGKTFRVCAENSEGKNPRWKPKKKDWKAITLPCDGQPAGVALFDRFSLQRKN
ncbi:MAG: metallophosphoesterase [Nitrospinota bacterium]|nr:metallophosphoesterase [Nitrospinota bacterium]